MRTVGPRSPDAINADFSAPPAQARLVAGGTIPGLARSAFTLHHPADVPLPVLIAVPHAGRAYPPGLAALMRDHESTALRLEDRFVDVVAREAAGLCSASLFVAHAPRAMIDLNRDPRDLDLTMFCASEAEKISMRRAMLRGSAQGSRSMHGLGLFPRRLPGIGEIWRKPMRPEEANRRIAAVHSPYHEALGSALAEMRDLWGEVLLLDLHSMPDLPARAAGLPAATHVLGDRFGGSCRRELVDTAMVVLESAGVEYAYNRPYAGGYVLERHADPRCGINAIQLELARSLYLDDFGNGPGAGVASQARVVADLILAVAGRIMQGEQRWPQAAE